MVYFLHPDIKMRQENFGGIIQTESGLYALDKNEYNFILNFHQTNVPDNLFMEKFLKINAICSIEEEILNQE